MSENSIAKQSLIRVPIQHSFSDEAMRMLSELQEECSTFICGGAARWMAGYGPDEYSDLDLYPISTIHHEKALIFLKKHCKFVVKASGYLGFEVTNFWFKPTEYPAITGLVRVLPQEKLQLVKIEGHPEEVISRFDFTACQFFADLIEEGIYTTPEAIRDNKDMQLVSTGVKGLTPLQGYRVGKYLKKGYRLSEENAIKLFSMLEDDDQRVQFINSVDIFCEEESLNKPKWLTRLKTMFELKRT